MRKAKKKSNKAEKSAMSALRENAELCADEIKLLRDDYRRILARMSEAEKDGYFPPYLAHAICEITEKLHYYINMMAFCNDTISNEKGTGPWA